MANTPSQSQHAATLAIENQFRRPKQARGIEKFNRMLDAAEALILDQPQKDLSLYDVAERAEVAVGSVYHFFPSADAVCVALIERYDSEFARIGEELSGPFDGWQDVVRQQVIASCNYLRANPVAQHLILGPGQSWATRTADLQGDLKIAQSMADAVTSRFITPTNPPPHELLFLAIRQLEAFWGTSLQRYNQITDATLDETLVAMEAYIGVYWPSQLAARTTD